MVPSAPCLEKYVATFIAICNFYLTIFSRLNRLDDLLFPRLLPPSLIGGAPSIPVSTYAPSLGPSVKEAGPSSDNGTSSKGG